MQYTINNTQSTIHNTISDAIRITHGALHNYQCILCNTQYEIRSTQ